MQLFNFFSATKSCPKHNCTNITQSVQVFTKQELVKRNLNKCTINYLKEEATRGIAKGLIWSSSRAITCGV